ncbi:MAG TPA: M13-type metalloendopeptidase [Xanthomonadaceae bacterium]|nr:M13-type metalloendopeptidase [Xanthomonadaceae bacterium]
MSKLRLAPLAAALALGLAGTAAAAEIDWIKPAELNREIAACADLNAFVNANWLAENPVPADRTTWGTFERLQERSLELQRELVEAAAASKASDGGIERKIGDIYATGMGAKALNAAGAAPLVPYLQRIRGLQDSPDLSAWLAETHARGQGFAFGFFPSPDFSNSKVNIAYAGQGGLSLPERAYYLEDKEDYVRIRAAFVDHVARILQLGGWTDDAGAARAQADAVLALETGLAQASLSPVQLRDPKVYYNPVSLEQADALTPHFPWSKFFDTLGVERPAMFSLGQPQFFEAFDRMLKDTPLAHWQAWFAYQTISGGAPYLSDALAEENFAFYGKALRGQAQMRPRWKRTLESVNGSMGEALGQLYVARTFPPEAKAQALELVQNLGTALKARIQDLEWMGATTKEKALEKWASFTPKIGYPDKWRSWDGLATSRESYLDNVVRAAKFNYDYQLAKIGKPVDPTEWGMTPQTVNAYYNPLKNEIVFPAAILQPPFFDPMADAALNYGGIGAVIGHEMIHGYDDMGSQFDAAGNFANWWSPEDRERFQQRTGKLVEQFDGYESIDGLHVKGDLTLGENIADLGGLSVAYDAFRMATAGKDLEPINGYTPEQRFFMNWAVVWRRNFKPEELRVRLNTDSHAPANFRAIGAPSNMASFARAFECGSDDTMVRTADQRVVIW